MTHGFVHKKRGVAAEHTTRRPSYQRAASDPAAQRRVAQLEALQEVVNRSPRSVAVARMQKRADIGQRKLAEPVQRRENATGMPDQLKSGLEQLSGLDLSATRVHYNSPKPAQLNAHAYTQGSEIYVAPGQQKHLAHEGWHAVQQMQGRVRPTMQLRDVAINDSARLEREADRMGAKAAQMKSIGTQRPRIQLEQTTPPVQRKIDLDKFFPGEERYRLFDMGLDLDDLEEIQDLLADPQYVVPLLAELERDVNEQFEDPQNELKYTKALGAALYQQEEKWMNVPGGPKDRTVIPLTAGVVANDPFLATIRGEGGGGPKPLKDVGAPVSHGEYAHRIQWFMISRALEKNMAERHGSDFLQNEGRPRREFQWLLNTLYQAMTDADFTKIFQKGQLLGASQEQRNNPVRGQFPLPLWSAILDMPGSFVDSGQRGEQDFRMFSDIFTAAPVKLTGALTLEGGGRKGAVEDDSPLAPLGYSQLSLAVLNRRIKRYLQKGNRGDNVLRDHLAGLNDPRVNELLARSTAEAPLDYDDRNEIAFRLLGII